MLSRSATMNLTGRASAIRRQRRRSQSAMLCSTNGCTTYLITDPLTGIASCPICGWVRRPS
jgi:hypothetical protein